VTGRHRGPKRKLRAGYRAPSVQRTSYLCVVLLCCERYIFRRRVWYRALSLRDVCIQSSGIVLIPWATFVPNFVSVANSTTELGLGEKSHIQSFNHMLNHSVSHTQLI